MNYKTNLNKHTLHYYIWGEYFKYPKCCIEACAGDELFRGHSLISTGTGYVPCKSCGEEILGMTEEEFTKWFGRDLFNAETSRAIVERKTEKYTELENKWIKLLD